MGRSETGLHDAVCPSWRRFTTNSHSVDGKGAAHRQAANDVGIKLYLKVWCGAAAAVVRDLERCGEALHVVGAPVALDLDEGDLIGHVCRRRLPG